MHVDLLTLYALAIGTLLASAALTFWDRTANPQRSKALRIQSTGYATLALGCASVFVRSWLPGISGSAASNLIIVSGYLLILEGVAALNGRRYRALAVGVLLLTALAWTLFGPTHLLWMWQYGSAMPIVVASALTSRELLRGESLQALHSRRIAILVTGFHALFYFGRAFVLPWASQRYGAPLILLVGEITMYEGVLYSVVLPMSLLRLVREETHGQLRREAQTDYLTRLGNRRWFFEEGERAIGQEAGHQPLAVLAFDLDHFKRINDHYGHQTGDQVLQAFAEIARQALGPSAILARIGGEEFAALLAGHDALRAADLGEEVARRFAQSQAGRFAEHDLQATVSVGLSCYQRGLPALAQMLSAADSALYQAKSLGGNRLERAAEG